MTSRFILFCILGAIGGCVVGAMVTATMLAPSAGSAASGGAYAQVLVGGIKAFALIGVFHGALLFVFTLGETPVIENVHTGRLVRGGLAERFDFRHFGSKVLPLSLVLGIGTAFFILPRLAVAGVTDLRAPITRAVACTVFALVWTVGAALINLTIVTKSAMVGSMRGA